MWRSFIPRLSVKKKIEKLVENIIYEKRYYSETVLNIWIKFWYDSFKANFEIVKKIFKFVTFNKFEKSAVKELHGRAGSGGASSHQKHVLWIKKS